MPPNRKGRTLLGRSYVGCRSLRCQRLRFLTFLPLPRCHNFGPFLRTNLISTLLPNACTTQINVPIARFRGSFSIAEIFGALISARAAKHNQATSVPTGSTCRSISETLPARFSHSKS
jgi:hypothetical protein